MPTNILMPALSPTMEEGKLAKWLVKEGQMVKSGDILAEIETDKATMEFEAVDEGKIGKILVPEGTEGVKVNAPIATLLEEGESADAVPAAKPAAPDPEIARKMREMASQIHDGMKAKVANDGTAPASAAPAPAAKSDGARVFA